MPFRHVALYRWADHVDADHVDRVRTAYDALAARIAGVRTLDHGPDVGVSEGTADYLVVADFESVVEWRAFRDHPEHVLLQQELIVGNVADHATGQFHVAGDSPFGPAGGGASAADPQTRSGAPSSSEAAPGLEPRGESDEELLERARRAAMADMQALLAEPDES